MSDLRLDIPDSEPEILSVTELTRRIKGMLEAYPGFANIWVRGEIALVNRLNAADLAICGRGGGSIEDLWSFNEEPVARVS